MNKVQSYIRSIIGAANGKKKTTRHSAGLIAQPMDRVKMDMSNLNSAVESALDPNNSDRIDLLTIYENAWKDSKVISEHEKADSYLITEPFEVRTSGSVNKEKQKLFSRPWFTDFLKIALHVEFWGYTLVEFQEQDEHGEFTGVKVFPRKYVRPFEKLIVPEPSRRDGISYAGNETAYYLLELGDPEVLGKLETISREIIWKTFARSDWSEYNERFGKPFLDFAVDTTNDEEIKAKVEMAENFGSNGYVIRDLDEEVKITAIASKAGAENFRDLATFCDNQIALLFNGQTGTSDEKSFVGSAEVHERVLDRFTEARLITIQNTINYRLIPFLREHGYPLTDEDEVCFLSLDPKEQERRRQITEPQQPDDPNDPDRDDDDDDQDTTGDTIGFFA